jgi:hypothetical protein
MGKRLLAALQEMEKYQTCHSNIRFTNSRGVKVMVFNATELVSDLWQVDGFLRVLWFPPSIKTDCHDIAQILFKVALNTITLTLTL